MSPGDSEREAAMRDIRSLLPASLRLGTEPATAILASLLLPGERPVSLVSGQIEGERLGQRSRLLLITDQRFALADLHGGAAAAWRWQDVNTFSTRNSNPASYAIDFITLSVLKSTSCMYVFRLKDGTRVTLVNVGPQRRGFTVGRRIAWYVRKAKMSGALSETAKAQDAVRLAGSMSRVLKSKAKTLIAPDNLDTHADAASEHGEDVTSDDVLHHLAALHEAGILTEEEVREKAAALDYDSGPSA
jgi:hypothetical protein